MKKKICSITLFLKKSRVGHPFFSKEHFVLTFFSILFKRTIRSLRSFTFSTKERFVLYVLFLALKRTLRSFFERFVRFSIFFCHFGGQKWFHKSPKTRKSNATFEKWTKLSFYRQKKNVENETFFCTERKWR